MGFGCDASKVNLGTPRPLSWLALMINLIWSHEGKASVEELPRLGWSMGSLEIVLIFSWGRKSQTTMSRTIPSQVGRAV